MKKSKLLDLQKLDKVRRGKFARAALPIGPNLMAITIEWRKSSENHALCEISTASQSV
jgi:hypothetical protein